MSSEGFRRFPYKPASAPAQLELFHELNDACHEIEAVRLPLHISSYVLVDPLQPALATTVNTVISQVGRR